MKRLDLINAYLMSTSGALIYLIAPVLIDHVTDRAVSGFLFSIFDSVFVMPEFPTDSDPFFFFLELCDVPLSISVIEHGEIKDEMVDEAKRVGRGYLSTYLPTVLKKRPLE